MEDSLLLVAHDFGSKNISSSTATSLAIGALIMFPVLLLARLLPRYLRGLVRLREQAALYLALVKLPLAAGQVKN
jgi:hypothetical protein